MSQPPSTVEWPKSFTFTPNENQFVYRGYCWEVEPTAIIVSALQMYDQLSLERIAHIGAAREHLSDSPEDAARDMWRSIHGYRQLRADARLFIAVDLVPWEIHEIQDETAYQHAMTEFARDRPR